MHNHGKSYPKGVFDYIVGVTTDTIPNKCLLYWKLSVSDLDGSTGHPKVLLNPDGKGTVDQMIIPVRTQPR